MKKPIIRYFEPEIRAVNEEERSVEFVISTEQPDTYGTVFLADGAETERYSKNPVFTYQHDDWSSDPDIVLGTSEIRQEGKSWVAKAFFENPEETKNELADKVFRKIKAQTLRMASILAVPTEGSFGASDRGEDPDLFYFRKWEFFGWSVVVHGSNPGALARSAEEIKFIEEHTPDQDKNQRVSYDDFDARIFNINKSITG
ncbi:hypothetical protein DN752_19600 [Echinicola strongylocentroti]|uniref:HK97 family phage prohead protease n=1 Tax=Echinicola strongylocentroti TaxID=1795355 RepID=A0A2Z4IN52_9BACT|nr:hypothetical protein [Echinicola strongylocentroti]AWW32167.1 hypothetical protein DN752_19600 [Echinicola strongylocentroti]